MIVDLLLEGSLEEHAARRLLLHTGHVPGPVYGRQGVQYIKDKASGFKYRAIQGGAVLVLTDFLDSGAACIPEALSAYLGPGAVLHPRYLLRFAVNMLESWLLADAANFAAWLGISSKRIPPQPESIPDPKDLVVALARKSRRKSPREDIVPYPGHGGKLGVHYFPAMATFVTNHWDLDQARKRAPSLDRCLRRLESL